MAQNSGPVNTGRRAALKGAVRAACGAGLLSLLLSIPARSKANAEIPLRPPGALPEPDFLAACVRCGLCVRDCPYDTLKLAEVGDGVPLGTPLFNARTVPCEMCENIPCVPVCPTGALDHALTDINKAKMGLAVLLDHETCLNWLGLRCDVCYRVCPRIDEAITLETQHNVRTGKHAQFIPTVHSEHCTGCGKCEKSCVLEKAAIKVLPLSEAKGALGKHYRLGWVEKDKAGGHSLLGDDMIKLPARGFDDSPALSTLPGLNGPEAGGPGTGGGAAP